MSQMRSRDRWLQLLKLCREQRWSLRRYELELRRYYAHPRYQQMSAVPTWIRGDVHDERLRRRQKRQGTRAKIQKQVQRAVANGVLIKPLCCESCKRRIIKQKLQGHHRDYRYPLNVVWLCPSCHVQAQGKRAVKRAALFARRREVEQRFDKKEETLRHRRKTGDISRRRYYELRREAFSKFLRPKK